jgi:hypothetical protein
MVSNALELLRELMQAAVILSRFSKNSLITSLLSGIGAFRFDDGNTR